MTLEMDRFSILTLPAPPPLPVCMEPVWDMPQPHRLISISSRCAWSLDSPLMSPNFKTYQLPLSLPVLVCAGSGVGRTFSYSGYGLQGAASRSGSACPDKAKLLTFFGGRQSLPSALL